MPHNFSEKKASTFTQSIIRKPHLLEDLTSLISLEETQVSDHSQNALFKEKKPTNPFLLLLVVNFMF